MTTSTTPDAGTEAPVDWPSLTRLPVKAQVYADEAYFREGLADVRAALGGETSEHVRGTALLVVKPDGMRTGKLLPATDFLVRHGFTVAAVEEVTYDRHLWQALWRYQLTSATIDRLAVNEVVLRGQGLLLLLRDTAPAGVPATVRLNGLKGSADVQRQAPDSLRAVLAQPNRVLSLVHVADEPADLVRELAIFLDRPRRLAALDAVRSGTLPARDGALLRAALLAASTPTSDLDVAAALRRATDAVSTVAGAHGEAAATAARLLGAMADGSRVPWRDFTAALDDLRVTLDTWDLALLGSTYITYDEPGRSKLIENVDPRLWRVDQR